MYSTIVRAEKTHGQTAKKELTNAGPNSPLYFGSSTGAANFPTSDMMITGAGQTSLAGICRLVALSSLYREIDTNRWSEWVISPSPLTQVPIQRFHCQGTVTAFVKNPSFDAFRFPHSSAKTPIDSTLTLYEISDIAESWFASGAFLGTILNEPEPDEALSAKTSLQLFAPKALQRIEHLMRLDFNWDGYGGLPITNKAIHIATQLLFQAHRLTKGELKLPFIAPLPEGGLELEWIQDSGKELTLVISPDGREIEFLLDIPSTEGKIDESEGVLHKDAQLSTLIACLD